MLVTPFFMGSKQIKQKKLDMYTTNNLILI